MFLTQKHDLMKIVNSAKAENEFIGQIKEFQHKTLMITITTIKIMNDLYYRFLNYKKKLQRRHRASQQLKVMHKRHLKTIQRLGPKIPHRQVTSAYL